MIKLLSVLCGLACAVCSGLPGALGSAEKRYGADYQGGAVAGSGTYSVSYARKTEDKYVNPYNAPTFTAGPSNACAVTAGGNAVVYYDRLCPDLIDGYAPTVIGSTAFYGSQTALVTSMFNDLYTKMGATSDGVTLDGFKTGLSSYVTGKGYNLSLSGAKGGYYNINQYYVLAQLKQNKLVTIFMSGFALLSEGGFSSGDGIDTVNYKKYTGMHVMLVYGYNDIYYYNSAGALAERHTFLYVSSGLSDISKCMLDLGVYGNVDDIYITSIS